METKDIDPQARERIADAVHRLAGDDFPRLQGWTRLAELSPDTRIEDIEVFEDEAVLDGNGFKVLANLYVSLNYHDDEGDETIQDAFPGIFTGTFQNGQPVIADMTVDTSSFFE